MSLTVTIGCPGAGKSTWAHTNLPPTTLRLERDRFRECIFGTRQGYHQHQFDRSDKSRVITDAMGAAMVAWPTPEWAVTDTGLSWPAVAPFVDYANDCDIATRLVIFDRYPSTLYERNANRPEEHRVPDDILAETIRSFFAEDAWWRLSDLPKEYV